MLHDVIHRLKNTECVSKCSEKNNNSNMTFMSFCCEKCCASTLPPPGGAVLVEMTVSHYSLKKCSPDTE